MNGENLPPEVGVQRLADQDFLCHSPADNQLSAFESQNEGAAGRVAFDFDFNTGDKPECREMRTHGPAAVNGNETHFAAGAGHREGYVV